MSDATYVLGRTNPTDQTFEVLGTGLLDCGAPSLNLAELRHQAAKLGAREVHLHFLAEGSSEMQRVLFDIQTKLDDENRMAVSPADYAGCVLN
ncbi:MAG: hypothetical protein AAFV45_10235 [Pseudomonadota bacterium]